MVLSSKKGGLDGATRCTSFSVSICKVFDIVGRNEAASWMHKSPI
jgi:hypothetical protein